MLALAAMWRTGDRSKSETEWRVGEGRGFDQSAAVRWQRVLDSSGILRVEYIGFSDRLNVKCEGNRGVWLKKLEEWGLDFTKMGTFMEAAGFGIRADTQCWTY